MTFEPPSPGDGGAPARRSSGPKIRITVAQVQAVRAGTVAAAAAITGVVTSEGAGTIAGFAVRLAVVSLAGFAMHNCAPAAEAWADRSPRAVWASSAPC
jgi:hypothetical protein